MVTPNISSDLLNIKKRGPAEWAEKREKGKGKKGCICRSPGSPAEKEKRKRKEKKD